jgi:hypothetical protein
MCAYVFALRLNVCGKDYLFARRGSVSTAIISKILGIFSEIDTSL